MSEVKDNVTKETFGYTEGSRNLFHTMNPNVPKGSFHLSKRGNSYYWYYRVNIRGKGNNRYLCKSFEGLNSDGMTSFQHSLTVLKEKSDNEFKRTTFNNTKLSTLIDEYVGVLLKEENNLLEGRKKETTQSLKNSINRFKDFCLMNDLRLSEIKYPKEFKLRIKEFIETLKNRGLKRHTIRTYLKGVKQFCDWLVDDLDGKGIIDYHPLNSEVFKKLHPYTNEERRISKKNVNYQSEWYEKMYQKCINSVGDIWRSYLKEGLSREHTNQPIGVGSDLVYFISLFQLGRGFRLGEILHSFRNKDSWENRRDKKNSSSFWYKRNGEWFLYIDWKGKVSEVPISGNYTEIRNWGEPPIGWSGKESGESRGDKYYDTSLVDVCMTLFRESDYLFSSPNYQSQFNKPYSRTYYMNIFKQRMVNKGVGGEGWEGYGVDSSHSLRDYFITHKIYSETVTPFELSQISRHSITTMMKYYKRDSEIEQLRITKKLEETFKIKSKYQLENDEKNEDKND